MTKEQFAVHAMVMRRVIERLKASPPEEQTIVRALEMLEHEYQTIDQILPPQE